MPDHDGFLGKAFYNICIMIYQFGQCQVGQTGIIIGMPAPELGRRSFLERPWWCNSIITFALKIGLPLSPAIVADKGACNKYDVFWIDFIHGHIVLRCLINYQLLENDFLT